MDIDVIEKPTAELSKDEIRRLDSVTEHNIARGYRVIRVPKEICQALTDEGLTAPEFIRLSRVNPARRRYINEEVQSRYHKDIRNQDVLSNAQVLKEVTERGEWNVDMQQRMESMQKSTTTEMGALWELGLTLNTATFSSDIVALVSKFRALVAASDKLPEEQAQVLEIFNKWAAYNPESKTPEYEGYEPEVVMAQLWDLAPLDAIDVINELDETKSKQVRLFKLTEQRVELLGLQVKHAKIFSDTAESRRDHTEEMAQLYFTCDVCDKAGKPKGKLAPTFNALWDFPDDAVRFLLHEGFFFHNDIPDGAREYLASFGFSSAEREPIENDPSAGSLVPPTSKLDGVSAEKTPADSGV